ncbi:MAG: PAS domain S-box protein [Deltaproteobacteria bacterium]|nr:PAS domain S-box protein [Deltaproteobacteria bacterium]
MRDRDDERRRIAVLEKAVENTNEAFVTIDSHHQVIFFNKAAEKIFGFKREEVVGRDLNVIMAPSCNRNHRDAVARYLKTGVLHRIGHDTEIMATRKNGEIFPANISFSVSEFEGVIYFTGIVRDLTETKALHERIARSERLAALGQAVAEITHEIKNPLMMIGGFARQLSREMINDKAISKLTIIMKEVTRLENLLNELRDLYLPKTLDKKEIDINALLGEVYELVRGDCESKNLHVMFSPDSEKIVVTGDREKLKQVLLNLAKNAGEATMPGGKISLSTSRKGRKVEIAVADEGSGIDDEQKEKIFDPFFTTKKGGTGLGLSVSKCIVEDHPESTLTFESQKEKGTIFKITMPVTETNEGNKGGLP